MPNKEVTIWSLMNLSNNLQISDAFVPREVESLRRRRDEMPNIYVACSSTKTTLSQMFVIQTNETVTKPTHDIHKYIQHFVCFLSVSSQFG